MSFEIVPIVPFAVATYLHKSLVGSRSKQAINGYLERDPDARASLLYELHYLFLLQTSEGLNQTPIYIRHGIYCLVRHKTPIDVKDNR